MISPLSIPISGRRTTSGVALSVQWSASSVWEATLGKAFAGDERLGPLLFGQTGRHPHHHPPHHNGEQLLGGVGFQRLLHLGKGDAVELDPAGVAGQLGTKGLDLFQRPLTGVRGALEVDGESISPRFAII